jgi:hypothetical protein
VDDPRWRAEERNIGLIRHPAPARGEDHPGLRRQLAGQGMLHGAKQGFAALQEYLRNREPVAALDFGVEVQERRA